MENQLLTIIRELADRLTSKGLTLSIAESCTGGFVSHSVTNLPGASDFFAMGVVVYTREAKKTVLGLSDAHLNKHGTVSEETAVAMANSVRKLGNTDVALAVTGIAGPSEVEGKEVGLVFMAVATENMVESQGMKFSGDREEIKSQASQEALTYLNRILRIWL